MSHLLRLLLMGALAAPVPALAQDAPAADEPADDAEEPPESFSGKPLPPARVPSPSGRGTISAETAEQYGVDEREHLNVVYLGAEALSLEPAFVQGVRDGLELMYKRDYKGSREFFSKLEQSYPGTGVEAVADLLVWQALMLENFDFKYDKQYVNSSRRAREALGAALQKPGQQGWEHFLMAGIVGVEAIHTMRKENYLPALQLAFEAMDHVQKSKDLVPKFTDLLLADGIYNYWRTVVTMNSKVLPDFGDKRVEGIQQMQTVEAAGVFLSPPATLSLAFSWVEENDSKRAISSSLRLRRLYPDNVINNLMLGRVYTNIRKFDSALASFDDVLRVAPDNKRVHYYRGITLLRANRVDEAATEFTTYLGYDYLESWQKSSALYRLGQVRYRQKRYDEAESHWKEAVKIDGHAGAKGRLEKLKTARKEGKLP